jgi:uncharacterized repeat protein (TIGR01451 family)
MKKTLLCLMLSILGGNYLLSQVTNNVDIQYYHDANNNCQQDPGEILLYNIPATTQMTYMNTSSMLAQSQGSQGMCPAVQWLFNPATPPQNTLALTFNNNNFSGWLVNTSCAAFTNLQHSPTVNYIPIQSYNQMGNVLYTMGGINYPAGSLNSYPVCNTIGNDTITFEWQFYNVYSCSGATVPRTYTLELDGVQFDHITATGNLWTSSTYTGSSNYAVLHEMYWSMYTQMRFTTKLPSGISNLGTHTLTIKSSQIYNNSQAVVNYTCLFNSSPCANISGKFYNDCDNNCTFGTGDGPLSVGVEGKIYDPSSNFSMTFYPDAAGNFALMVPSSVPLSLTQYPLLFPNVGLTFTACTTGTVVLPVSASTNTLMYGYKTTPYFDPGVSIYRGAGGTTNPGNTIKYNVQTFSGASVFNCNSTIPVTPGQIKVKLRNFMSYGGMILGNTPTIVPNPTGDTLVWNVSNIFANSVSYHFNVVLSSTISLMTPFTIEARMYPSANDNNNANNLCVVSGTVGVPHDPNNKIAYAVGIRDNGDIPNTTTEMFYTINFQNIGTAPAVNVKTIDTIDVNFELSTLRILQSSFPVSMQVNHASRQVGFFFTGINLADATSNEPASHGFVRYSIKLKNGTPTNTVLKNRAHNYFDYTDPVATNQTINKLVASVGLTESSVLHSVSLRPNPSNGLLTVEAGSDIEQVSLYNQVGQLQMTAMANTGTKVNLNLTDLPEGVYFVTIELSSGESVTRKIVKN